MSTGTSPDPNPQPKHPILRNLGKLLMTYGPVLLEWLINSGIIKLPGGVPLPPLPTPGAQADPAVTAQLEAIDAEVDLAALHQHLGHLHSLAADVLS